MVISVGDSQLAGQIFRPLVEIFGHFDLSREKPKPSVRLQWLIADDLNDRFPHPGNDDLFSLRCAIDNV